MSPMPRLAVGQVPILLASIVLAWSAPRAAEASTLYTVNVSGNGNFLSVDQTTGVATPINPDGTLGPLSWDGLAATPTTNEFLYALHNPRPVLFEDPQTSQLARIRVSDGQSTLFPLFNPSVLGFPQPFSTAIAISPLNPDVALVAAFERTNPGPRILFRVDLATGDVMSPAIEIERKLSAMTFSLDGSTLYGTDSKGLLVRINPTTGGVTTIGDPGLSDFITGLSFRPEDGVLFAINALTTDELIVLNPTNGAVVSRIGRLGIPGPEGLAFLESPPPLIGDTNNDGMVDLEDLNNVRNNFGGMGAGVLGDTNDDGMVDLEDLNNVRNNFGAGRAAAVPEPSAWLLLVLGGVLVGLFSRR